MQLIPLHNDTDLTNGLKSCFSFHFCWDTCITSVDLESFSLPKYVTSLS